MAGKTSWTNLKMQKATCSFEKSTSWKTCDSHFSEQWIAGYGFEFVELNPGCQAGT